MLLNPMGAFEKGIRKYGFWRGDLEYQRDLDGDFFHTHLSNGHLLLLRVKGLTSVRQDTPFRFEVKMLRCVPAHLGGNSRDIEYQLAKLFIHCTDHAYPYQADALLTLAVSKLIEFPYDGCKAQQRALLKTWCTEILRRVERW
jgi:hypothetical protein